MAGPSSARSGEAARWARSGPRPVPSSTARSRDSRRRASSRFVGTTEGQGPNRTMLETTPAGREAVRGWLREPVEHVRDVRTVLLVKLLLLERRGVDRSSLVRDQRELLRPVAAALGDSGRRSDRPGPARRRVACGQHRRRDAVPGRDRGAPRPLTAARCRRRGPRPAPWEAAAGATTSRAVVEVSPRAFRRPWP